MNKFEKRKMERSESYAEGDENAENRVGYGGWRGRMHAGRASARLSPLAAFSAQRQPSAVPLHTGIQPAYEQRGSGLRPARHAERSIPPAA